MIYSITLLMLYHLLIGISAQSILESEEVRKALLEYIKNNTQQSTPEPNSNQNYSPNNSHKRICCNQEGCGPETWWTPTYCCTKSSCSPELKKPNHKMINQLDFNQLYDEVPRFIDSYNNLQLLFRYVPTLYEFPKTLAKTEFIERNFNIMISCKAQEICVARDLCKKETLLRNLEVTSSTPSPTIPTFCNFETHICCPAEKMQIKDNVMLKPKPDLIQFEEASTYLSETSNPIFTPRFSAHAIEEKVSPTTPIIVQSSVWNVTKKEIPSGISENVQPLEWNVTEAKIPTKEDWNWTEEKISSTTPKTTQSLEWSVTEEKVSPKIPVTVQSVEWNATDDKMSSTTIQSMEWSVNKEQLSSTISTEWNITEEKLDWNANVPLIISTKVPTQEWNLTEVSPVISTTERSLEWNSTEEKIPPTTPKVVQLQEWNVTEEKISTTTPTNASLEEWSIVEEKSPPTTVQSLEWNVTEEQVISKIPATPHSEEWSSTEDKTPPTTIQSSEWSTTEEKVPPTTPITMQSSEWDVIKEILPSRFSTNLQSLNQNVTEGKLSSANVQSLEETVPPIILQTIKLLDENVPSTPLTSSTIITNLLSSAPDQTIYSSSSNRTKVDKKNKNIINHLSLESTISPLSNTITTNSRSTRQTEYPYRPDSEEDLKTQNNLEHLPSRTTTLKSSTSVKPNRIQIPNSNSFSVTTPNRQYSQSEATTRKTNYPYPSENTVVPTQITSFTSSDSQSPVALKPSYVSSPDSGPPKPNTNLQYLPPRIDTFKPTQDVLPIANNIPYPYPSAFPGAVPFQLSNLIPGNKIPPNYNPGWNNNLGHPVEFQPPNLDPSIKISQIQPHYPGVIHNPINQPYFPLDTQIPPAPLQNYPPLPPNLPVYHAIPLIPEAQFIPPHQLFPQQIGKIKDSLPKFHKCPKTTKCVPETFCTPEGYMIYNKPNNAYKNYTPIPLLECEEITLGFKGICCTDLDLTTNQQNGEILVNMTAQERFKKEKPNRQSKSEPLHLSYRKIPIAYQSQN